MVNLAIQDTIKEMKDYKGIAVVVLYHAWCMDGNGVLMTIRELFPDHLIIPKACEYDNYSIDEILKLVELKNVIMGDFSMKREDLMAIKDASLSFVALDHHESAIERFKPFNFTWVDMEESGATLVWKYCCNGEPVPALLQYIKDRDLWQHKLPNTREVNAAAFDIGFEEPKFLQKYLHDVSELIEIGTPIIKEIDDKVKNIITRSTIHKFKADGKEGIFIINDDEVSLVGNHLSMEYPYVAQIKLDDTKVKISFRSSKENQDAVNVAKLCEKYGGGGHKHAAGLSVAFEDIDISMLLITGDLDKSLKKSFMKRITDAIRIFLYLGKG